MRRSIQRGGKGQLYSGYGGHFRAVQGFRFYGPREGK